MSKKFSRRKRARPVKTTFLIVCEGSCEQIYFENMKRSERLTNINIDIHNPKISTPAKICDYTKEKQKERGYDLAFCVVDGDCLKPGDLKPGSKIKFIISHPCFEVWFLLHFEYTSKDFYKCDNLINDKLKKRIPDYEKSQAYHKRKKFYGILKERLNDAIKHARKLDEENRKNGKQEGTSTKVYKLIEKIFSTM